MNEILELPIGLTYGIINEKNNQILRAQKKTEEEKIIQGDATMLMKM